jgi:hypothetical protein
LRSVRTGCYSVVGLRPSRREPCLVGGARSMAKICM